jgi:hypothetical protein
MDPDLVRQQEEAERESLLAVLQKPATLSHTVERVVTAQENIPAFATAQKRTPVSAILGRFVMYCIAGAILGGGIGIVAASMMTFTPEETNIARLSIAVATALVCGAISLMRN